MPVIDKDTRNFNIKVEEPEETQDGGVKARIIAKPLGEEETGYGEKIKIKGRSCSEYANNIQDMFQLSEEEQNDLKTDIMRLKNEIRDHAEQAELEDEFEDDGQDNIYPVMQELMAAGDVLPAEALEDEFPEVRMLADEYDDWLVQYTGNIEVTDEGKQALREHLGMEAFEGDPEAEAQAQLEDDPFRYYLDSFNKIHKGDHLLKIWELISALSATCSERQIHSWAVGPSGKGKSHLKRELLKFLPPEAYEQKESFSPKALQYKSTKEGAGFLDNQLVYFDEVGEDDVENAIELMRLMTDQDQDVITHETVRDQEILTIPLEVGNITVWFTSVETIQDEQLKNRFILTNPDASSAQDKTVNEHQQNILNFGGDLDFTPKEAPVVQRMVRDLRTNTPDFKPIVPFKIDWKQEFNRRLYPFFYTLMGMIAKVHYKNRETKDGYIFVTKADFELAKLIWGKLIDTTVAQTDEQSIALLKQLPESESDALTRRELHLRLDGFSTNKVAETCDKLEETEELQLINTKYDEGKYWHWAGADMEKLVDNQPEPIDLNRESVKEMIQEAGVEPTDAILDNIFDAEIKVTEFLKEKVEEKRINQEEDEDELDIEITDDEEYVLQQFNEFGWEATLQDMNQMHQQEDDPDFVAVGTDLEEKEVIRINDDTDKPSPTATLDQLKAEGEVLL